jgi:hypothetical protein
LAPILISFSRRLVSDHGSRRLGHRQRPHEVAEVIGERVKLEADGVGGEGTASQPRPFDRPLPFLDALFRRTSLVVEGDDALRRARQVGHDEADTWVKLTRNATRSWLPPGAVSSSFAPDS